MAEEDGKQRDHPGDDPYIARETVGVIPVILVVKRPREADAHGVVMAALGQIIADGDEEQADENHAETRDVDGEAQRAQVYGQADEQADGGADPQDELRHLLGDILLFGIGAQHDGAEELHGEDKQREAELLTQRPKCHRIKSLDFPANGLIVPVSNDLLLTQFPKCHRTCSRHIK